MRMTLVEVKYIEPAKRSRGFDFTLKNCSSHPARIRYTNAWMFEDEGRIDIQRIGDQHNFQFEDGVCRDFLDGLYAEIVGEIDEERVDEADRYELLEPPTDEMLTPGQQEIIRNFREGHELFYEPDCPNILSLIEMKRLRATGNHQYEVIES